MKERSAMRRFFVVVILVLASCLWAMPAGAQTCDRACLRDVLNDYLDALVAHDPGRLQLSDDVRFTEDTVVRNPGEGLWATATRLRGFRQDVLDVGEGIAASQVLLDEGDAPVMLMLRLRVRNGEITEIESVVTRSREEGAIFDIAGIESSDRTLMNYVPTPSERMSREEAIRTAEFYPSGLKVGSFVAVDAPFAPDAYRLENGGRMAGPGCSRGGCEDIKTQRIIEHPDVTTRVVAVDEAMGLVLLRMNFGDTGSYGAGNALIVWEVFKVFGGQMHAVEAFMEVMPADAPSGWD
jgi:hypothetical protein